MKIDLDQRLARAKRYLRASATRPAWALKSEGYPSWRRQRRGRILSKLLELAPAVIGGFAAVAFAWVMFFRAELDLSAIDRLLDAPSYTFYSDMAEPRAAAMPCSAKLEASPSPDDVIGMSGASRPNAATLIECAKEEMKSSHPGDDRARWGTSRNLIDAIVAQEDRRFWTRKDVNPIELIGAFSANLDQRGGSTLSMQIIKNVYFRSVNDGLPGDGETKKNSRDASAYRNLYSRSRQQDLEDHIRLRLAQRTGKKPGEVPLQAVKAEVMSLYLLTASSDRPNKDDRRRKSCELSGAQEKWGRSKRDAAHTENLKRPECIDLLGAARVARRYYGKRIDQLTIAEAASVAASLRGPDYSPGDQRNRLQGDCARLKLLAPKRRFFNNRCAAEYTIRVMAGDPAVLRAEGFRARFAAGRPLIPGDQLPPTIKAPGGKAMITQPQADAALAELGGLVICGANVASATPGARERLLWCNVGRGGSGRANEVGEGFSDWLRGSIESDLAQFAPDVANDVAIYTTLNVDAQRAAEFALTKAPGNQGYVGRPDLPPPVVMALVTVNANGEIKALAGHATSGTSGLPGSTLKPFVFARYLQQTFDSSPDGPAAALRAFEAHDWANDCAGQRMPYVPGINWPAARSGNCGGGDGKTWAWLPRNAGGVTGFRGGCDGGASNARGSIREAICRSLNTVTAEVAIKLTRGPIANDMDRLGLVFFDGKGGSGSLPATAWNQSVIGEGEGMVRPLDLAGAYTVFLNDGAFNRPFGGRMAVVGRSEVALRPTIEPAPIYDAHVASLIRAGLADVVTKRNGTAFGIFPPEYRVIGGKTGTTETDGQGKPKDIWFVGFQDGPVPEITVIWLSYSTSVKKYSPRQRSQIEGLGGKDAAKVYLGYLEKRAQTTSPRAGGAPS